MILPSKMTILPLKMMTFVTVTTHLRRSRVPDAPAHAQRGTVQPVRRFVLLLAERIVPSRLQLVSARSPALARP